MTVSAYDTAWVARVLDSTNPDKLLFTTSFEWLLQNHTPDGSWGGRAPYSFIPTMAALLALLKVPDRYRKAGEDNANRAHVYLKQYLPAWSIRSFESIGFEILAPALLAELETVGIVLTFPAKEDLMRLYREKLLLAPQHALYEGLSTLLHSLEAFASHVDLRHLKLLQAGNGSYGCSPAATAATLVYGEGDHAATAWLNHLSQLAFEGEAGAMPNVHPTDVFDAAWSLYLLAQSNSNVLYTSPQISALHLQLMHWLRTCLSPKGASMSRCVGMPNDADDTSMIIASLHSVGAKPPLDGLCQFERESYFVCYDLERNPSVSVNAHVLAALLSAPASSDTSIQIWADNAKSKLVDFLYTMRKSSGCWDDKFFLGPYYGTSACVLALTTHSDQRVRSKLKETATWLLETQSGIDGGWGMSGSTLEETAYALLSLQALQKIAGTAQSPYVPATRKGMDYLWQHLPLSHLHESVRWPSYEKLWIGKELYAPQRIVTSAILAALSCDPDCLDPATRVPFKDIQGEEMWNASSEAG